MLLMILISQAFKDNDVRWLCWALRSGSHQGVFQDAGGPKTSAAIATSLGQLGGCWLSRAGLWGRGKMKKDTLEAKM